MKPRPAPLLLVIAVLVLSAGPAEAVEDETMAMVLGGILFLPLPILAAGYILYHILKQYNRRKVLIAAIEKGASLPDIPQEAEGDLRKSSLMLIAIGLGFSIATFVTLSYVDVTEAHPLMVSIWGIVPILVGIALMIYHRLADGD